MHNLLDVFLKNNAHEIDALSHDGGFFEAYNKIRRSYFYYEAVTATTIYQVIEHAYKTGFMTKNEIMDGLRLSKLIDGEFVTEDMCVSFLNGSDFRKVMVTKFVGFMKEDLDEKLPNMTVSQFNAEIPNAK